ncbi:unnamed protein product [Diabrotica balteata]|uniref:Peptidase S1 domain-containing protein n=1 Tax=Diabrotica balteata TaxID=107213 RepID=A0A9P0GWT7_DIABA|nr:unnamed protein product [Diabrotica balteata]
MGRNLNIAWLVCIFLLKCNFVDAGKRFRIFGGKETRIENHPWMVSLIVPDIGHNCGGSLINEDTVLTAAHCLAEKVKYSDKIKPINLPEEGLKVTEGTSAVVAGWGRTEPLGNASNILMETKVKVSKSERDYLIVAGERKSGICGGDSGGPLELEDTIVGIVSYTSGPECEESGIPGKYMNVPFYRTWIDKTLNSFL